MKNTFISILILFLRPASFTQVKSNSGVISTETYGPYDMQYNYIKSCDTVRSTYIVKQNYQLVKKDGKVCCLVNATLLVPLTVTLVKMAVFSVKDRNTKNQIWNYEIKKPCQNFILGSILRITLNTTESCTLKPGHFGFVFESELMLRKIFGTSFFYGHFIIKARIYSEKAQMISCLFTDYDIVKSSTKNMTL